MTSEPVALDRAVTNDDSERAFAPSRPVKRSFSIAGHRTSISLEAAFWDALRSIATSRECSLASLVAEIDRERGSAGLSGAIRVWILDYYRRDTRAVFDTSEDGIKR